MHTNRLIHESSPYLVQHGHNPVDWYPWGAEAFAKARSENKPVLLSIGYSACHWCHVMEAESFENEAIAAVMNEHFVCIKVDREERPDLDELYMNAVQMLTQRGGWPMTVFLTPEGKPFFGGTYYPPEDRHGMPGFPKVLKAVAEAYRSKQQDVAKNVDQIVAALNRMSLLKKTDHEFDPDIVVRSAEALAPSYDQNHGGFGQAPKFPNAGVYNLFLRSYCRSGNHRHLEMITETVTKIAEGGIYDQLGGGFHRYSVDDRWLVPHFEKMLYDNAQLLQIYADMYRITNVPFFRAIVAQTAAYLLREMLQPEGGFYSTQDADSEGEEGKFFVWTRAEVQQVLGEDRSAIFSRVYDVTEVGNFEGKNILHRVLSLEQAGKYFERSEREIAEILDSSRQRLFDEREKRVKPFRDEKVITSWNGLALSGLAAALAITGEGQIREAAERTVAFTFEKLFEDGFLLHTYKDGHSKLLGYLDDYAFMIAGLLDLYETTLRTEFLERSVQLADIMVENFWDESDGAFFYTGKAHEKLISRTKPSFDGSIPSGNSVAAHVLLRLYYYTGTHEYFARGEEILRLYYDSAVQQPYGLSSMLGAMDLYLSTPIEIVLVATEDDPGAQRLLAKIHGTYLPNRTIRRVDPTEDLETVSPLLAGKSQVHGKATVYVCRNFTCAAPVTEWEELEPLLTQQV